MEVVLLERVTRLGRVGDVVNVKNGYGRNFLIPTGKALRATKANVAEFEAQRDVLEKRNAEAKTEAEKRASALDGLSVKIVRQASEDGRLYGSVNARDVELALKEAGQEVERRFINLSEGIKSLGLYKANIALHGEVTANIDLQVVRSLEASAYDEIAKEEAEAAAAAEAEAKAIAEAEALAAKTADTADAEEASEETAEATDEDAA